MAVIRTFLSLISFGFAIFQFFRQLREQEVVSGTGASQRRFGETLVALGIVLPGTIYHVQYMRQFRKLRSSTRDDRLIHGETTLPFRWHDHCDHPARRVRRRHCQHDVLGRPVQLERRRAHGIPSAPRGSPNDGKKGRSA